MTDTARIADFMLAAESGDLDAATAVFHRLPAAAQDAVRGELARLRGEDARRFQKPRDMDLNAPQGVALRSRQG